MLKLNRVWLRRFLKYFIPVYLITAAALWYFKPELKIILGVIAAEVLATIVMAEYSRSELHTILKKDDKYMTDFYKDFVKAGTVSGLTIGKDYLYWNEGIRMKVLPCREVDSVYEMINNEYVEYVDTGERELVHKRVSLGITDIKGNTYSLKMTEKSIETVMIRMGYEHPEIRLGYSEG